MRRAAIAAASVVLLSGVAALSAWAADRGAAQQAAPHAVAGQGPRNAVVDPDQPQADPAVRQGVLPNGLRYLVMSNSRPARGLSIRMRFQVGSYDERDDERGAAHFLEHMAFNGTRHIPEGRIDTVFGTQGVRFGRDQNASTGLFETRYELDMPQVDEAKMDLAFQWLRDIGDGVNLEPAAISRERGVVKAEDDRSKGPERTWWETVEKWLSPELRSTSRSPIGTPESVASMDQARLRGFYERWYRPDNAIIVVVGDFPAEALEQRVKDTFGDWKPAKPGPMPERVARSKPNLTRTSDILTLSEPAIPTNASICWVRPDDNEIPDTVDRLRLTFNRRMWRDVVNERLRGLAGGDNPPFVGAQVSVREDDYEALYVCLDVLPVSDDWQGAVKAAVTEIRRLDAHGVTQDEMIRARDGIRSEFRAQAESMGARTSGSIADKLVTSAADGDVVATPVERFRLLERVALTTKVEDVNAAFRRDWSGGGPLIEVTTPSSPAKVAAVKAVWTEALAGPAPAAIDQSQSAVWAYGDFGAPGQVVKREVIANPGFVRLWFANGVVVNFKQLDKAQDRVKVRVRFGQGRREIPNTDFYAAQVASGLFVEGGLGKHDAETVRRLFNDHGWSADMDIGPDFFVLEGTTNPTDLGVEMQILTAYVTDPGFRRSVDAKLPTTVELMDRSTKSSPDFALSQALYKTIAPDGVYVMPSKDKLLKMDSRTFERILKPALTTSPIEITVVGDISEDRVISAIAKTFGALPARPPVDRKRGDTWFLRYPAKTPAPIRTTYESNSDKAVVQLVWPLYVAEPKRRREEYALMVLSSIMDDAIRHKVREEMGTSYAPQVGMTSPDDSDQGSIQAYIETTSGDADAVARAAAETAAEISRDGVSEEAFEAAKKPILDASATRLDDIDWWLGGLDGSAGNYEILREFLDWDADMGSVTLADVNRVAKVWLAKPPIVVIATPKPPQTASAAAAAAKAGSK